MTILDARPALDRLGSPAGPLDIIERACSRLRENVQELTFDIGDHLDDEGEAILVHVPEDERLDARLTLSAHGYKLEASVLGLIERLLNEVEEEITATIF